MVDLTNEKEVERRAQERHNLAMYRYRQDLEREASLHKARQGGRPVYFEGSRHSYFLDQARQALHGVADENTERRIMDYRNQSIVAYERRTGINETDGTGGVAVPPDWIEDAWVSAAHEGCPLGAAATAAPLPPGTDQIIIPGLLDGQSFSTSSTQNSSVSEQAGSITDGTISVPITTLQSRITVSRQLIDQAPRGIDLWLGLDSAQAYSAAKAQQLWSGTGSGGQVTGVLNWSNTLSVSADGSTAGFWSGLAAAQADVYSNLFLPANVAFVSPLTWQWVTSTVDEEGRPFLLPHTQTPDALLRVPQQYFVAQLAGLSIIADPALPTGSVVVARSSELAVYEGDLQFVIQREAGATDLSVTITAYRYLAFAIRRPAGVCILSFTPSGSGS
jgi:HK97 family phage major capsid protein